MLHTPSPAALDWAQERLIALPLEVDLVDLTMSSLTSPSQMPAAAATRCARSSMTLLDQFQNIGARVKDTAYGVLSRDGLPARFFGLIELRLPNVADDDFGLMVGLPGSYDQTLPRGLAVGSRVFVCDNLAFSSEVTIKTKQTTYIGQRLPRLIAQAVDRIPSLSAAQSAKFGAYRNTTIGQRAGDAMLVELVRRGAMVPSQLGVAISECDSPSHKSTPPSAGASGGCTTL